MNPALDEVVAQTPLSNKKDFDEAIMAASEAFKTWSNVSPSERVRYMLKYQSLIRDNIDELSKLITEE